MTGSDAYVLEAMGNILTNVDVNTDNGKHVATIATCMIRQDGRLGRIQSDVSTLKSDVSTLKSDVSTLKSDVSTLKSDVKTLKSDVATLKEDVKGIDKKIDILHDSINKSIAYNEYLVGMIDWGPDRKKLPPKSE